MHRTALIATAAAAALLVPASALAAPGWTPPETTGSVPFMSTLEAALGGDRSVGVVWADGANYELADGPGGGALTPRGPLAAWWADIDADDAGNLTVAWAVGSAVNVATRPPGGAFGAPEQVSTAGAQAYVDVSPGGTTLVAWRGGTGLRARIRPAGGSFGPELVIVATDVNEPVVAVADSGEAIAAWETQSGTVQHKIRPAGGVFPEQPSAFGDVEVTGDVDVAMNARGDAQLVFSANDAEGHSRYGGGHRGPGEAFRYDGEVSEPIGSSSMPSVAIAENGDGLLAWVSGPLAQASVRRGEDYDDLQNLSTGGLEAGTVAAAMSPAGEAVVAWDEDGAAADDATLQVARRAPQDAAFGEPVELDVGGEHIDDLRLRSNARGDVVAVYGFETADDTRVRHTLWRAADPKTPAVKPTPGGGGRAAVVTPATGGAQGSQPSAPRSAPAPGVSLARLQALKVRRRGGRALVRFTLIAPAKVTLTVERRQGRRWRPTTRKVTVQARTGKASAALSLRGLRGRLRIVAKVAGAPRRATAAVPAARR